MSAILKTIQNNGKTLISLAILSFVIVVAYIKIFSAGFISWDDPEYILHNADINGISLNHIFNWFSKCYIGNYHPVTLLSYAIDHLMFGWQPWGFHFINILLHIFNAFLVYILVSKLQPRYFVSLLTALIFALHPVQTESVSWVAERKTLLCAFFYFLSLLKYIKYVKSPSPKYYFLVVLFSLLAMLSKAEGVALPFVFFAIDTWLKRTADFKKLVIEK